MEKHNSHKVILIILDGWGYAPSWGGNAVDLAETPNFNNYWRRYPHVLLNASQEAVGLPRHEPGNSEVGHLNIGSGQIVRQNLVGISEEIKNKSFFKNKTLLNAIKNAKDNNGNIHLIGLVSDGGVHSHIDHLFALLDLIKNENFQNVYIHMITDGRDTDPMKALSYLEKLENKLKDIKMGRIVSIMGRFYPMDRDNRWDRIEKAYEVLAQGVGPKEESAQKAISSSYRKGFYDEFIVPTIIENKENFVPIQEKDSVIFFNFRSDRTKELTWAFVKENFKFFQRKKFLKNLFFATYAFHEEYEEKLPVKVVFGQIFIKDTIGKSLQDNNLSQYHIAETEKYAHVTYFFDGGKAELFKKQKNQLIPSPKVPTYDLKPQMSANRVKDTLLDNLKKYDFSLVNFANPDMVGHTGNLKATVKACETVDACLGEIVPEALKDNRIVIITADHGNAEQMINPNTGEPHTEHTLNPVPFICISNDNDFQDPLRSSGGEHGLVLADIAPTILEIMKLEIPKDFMGKSLIE